MWSGWKIWWRDLAIVTAFQIGLGIGLGILIVLIMKDLH